jgi:hypothetical protein
VARESINLLCITNPWNPTTAEWTIGRHIREDDYIRVEKVDNIVDDVLHYNSTTMDLSFWTIWILGSVPFVEGNIQRTREHYNIRIGNIEILAADVVV